MPSQMTDREAGRFWKRFDEICMDLIRGISNVFLDIDKEETLDGM